MSRYPTRKERIMSFITEQSRLMLQKSETPENVAGFNASWISLQLGFSRDNVSRDLNQLHRDKQLIKVHGKPVLFLAEQSVEDFIGKSLPKLSFNCLNELQSILNFNKSLQSTTTMKIDVLPVKSKIIVKNNDSPFIHLIGYDRSLKTAVKQAKAAILYPPNGLHSLIIGPTGGGKTTLAKVMYIYAKQTQRLKENAPYIIFNCADYAGNPQLLLSHLFGHKKGAFTGATDNHTGLVEKANHGILFLDEVHRLPPEGQEMLFSLIDRGEYYQLGDVDNIRKAEVLIIAATTEKPGTAVLQTFLRRIPNLIELPDLENRSLDERYSLIKLFFQKEAKNMDIEIHVSAEIIKLFLIYDCPGNVGQLENDIKLICANAFVNFITEKHAQLHVKLSHLPAQYLKSFDILARKRSNLNTSFDTTQLKDISFSPEQPVYTPTEDPPQMNFYQLMINNSRKYFADNLSLNTIKEIFNNQITEYFDVYSGKKQPASHVSDEMAFLKIISPQIYQILKDDIALIEQEYDLQIPVQVFHGLVLHVETMLERIRQNKPLTLPENNSVINKNDIYYQISKHIITSLEQKLQITIPKQEIILISLCLQTLNISNKISHIGVLVLTHGYHAATDFANVANRLLDVKHAHGLCMPLEEKVSLALERATKLVKKIDEGKGVLILSDMGSLTTFGELITKSTGIKTCTLRMVSTPMVIEATRKALLPTISLEQLANEVVTQSYYVGINASIPNQTPLIAKKFNFDFNKIINLIENTLVFIDARKAVPLLEGIFADITSRLNLRQDPSLYIKFMFHTSCMLERAIRNDQMEYGNLSTLLIRHNNMYNIIKDSFTILERTYGINIYSGELYYITEIFAIAEQNSNTAL
ncbi:sigma 54-interacting transcriptional regulator [Pectinatus frisingensis]|uniref:sigma 54-interacting transcriptional regulator n=1 Tax=Pectinatus frisingensis TaxID=865 RepID=UPI0018C566FA|nr:sigma-54-dependent transcriptional regulator [Pectinatus frisingensis]